MTEQVPNEPSIEHVLKELRQDVDKKDTAPESSPQEAGDAELKNLKNVLLEADLQAGTAPAQEEPPEPAPSVENKEIAFNENFLKLEQLIKAHKNKE